MLKRNIVANYVGTAWNAVMSIAFVPVYVKYLGTEAYGLIGLSATVGSFLLLLDAGLSPMLSREMARFRGGAHTSASIRSLLMVVQPLSWTVGLVGMCSLWLMAPWLASAWLREESLTPDTISHALRVVSAVIGLRFVESVYRSVLMGLQRQVAVNAISCAAATLRGVGSIAVLAWWSPTLDAFFWWQAAIAAASVVTFATLSHTTLPRAKASVATGVSALRTAWPFARGMLLSQLLLLALLQTDKLLLSRLLDLAQYGQYMLAVTAASCVSLIAQPITQAFHPRLAQSHVGPSTKRFAEEVHRMAQSVTVFAASVGVTLIVFADQIMLAWTGDPQLVAATTTPLRLIAATNLVGAFLLAPYHAQLAAGRTVIPNTINTICVFATIPLLLLIVPWAGMAGAAYVILALYVVHLVIGVPLCFKQQMPEEFRAWCVNDVVIPLAAAAVTATLIRVAATSVPHDLIPSLATIGVGGTACFLATIATASRVRKSLVATMTGVR
jgi:O-antigen/teichoic acid export membrane protein